MASRTNVNPMELTTTRVIDDQRVLCEIESHGALFNSERTLVQFSLNYDNGHVAHYILTHHETKLEKIADLVIHYGLMVVEGKFISKRGMGHVKKFGSYAAKMDLNSKITDWLDNNVWSHVGLDKYYYTNMATQKIVFEGPVKASGGVELVKVQ
jgi:hypothetical protein